MASLTTMQSVKAEAKRQLSHLDGVVGFGLGDNVLRIYVRDSKVRERLPVEMHGVPVEIVVTGEISAQT